MARWLFLDLVSQRLALDLILRLLLLLLLLVALASVASNESFFRT